MTILFVAAPLFVSSAIALGSVISIMFWTEVAEFTFFLLGDLLVLMNLLVPQLESSSGNGDRFKVSS